MMEKEKAEIAELAAKYGRVQSLMRYVNKETLAKSYSRQPRGKAVGRGRCDKGNLRRKSE